METAAISDVTSAMMDEAAHRAAEAVEAVTNSSVIQAHVDEDFSGESASHPLIHVAATENQTEVRDTTVPSEGEILETMPAPSVSPVEPAATSAPVEGAEASFDAEAAAVQEASGAFALGAPPVVVSTPKTEAAESNDETPRWDLTSPGEAMGAYGAQVAEMLADNIAASSHFLTALMSATSITDVMTVNTNHLRRHMELLTTQRRQLTTLARTIAFDAMKPFSAWPTDHGRDR